MDNLLDALRTSVRRLRDIVGPLDDDAIVRSAYPTDWTIAQVMSHVGSASVILGRRVADALAGADTPDEFAPSVWDVWNAKSPRAQVDDALAADAAFLAQLEGLSDDQRRGLSVALGPMRFDVDQLVSVRLNEHALHTWDVDVALDPAATIPPDVAEAVVDNLDLIARYTAKPVGDPTTITVRTHGPERHFTVEVTADVATLTPSIAGGEAVQVELPAEAFARLVYGRLDADHIPASVGDPALLNRLRATFPGA